VPLYQKEKEKERINKTVSRLDASAMPTLQSSWREHRHGAREKEGRCVRRPLLRRHTLRGDSARSSTALVLAIAHFKVCIAPLHTSQVLNEVRMPVKVQYLVSPGPTV
jgi:hypothetical protein